VHDENGILVEPEDEVVLQEAIRGLLFDDDRISQLEKRALLDSEQFTDSYFAGQLQEECLKLINQK